MNEASVTLPRKKLLMKTVDIDVYGDVTTKKTTVTLRDDVYQTLKEKAGARNISNQINKILISTSPKKKVCLAP